MPLDVSFFAKDLAYQIADLPGWLVHAGKKLACATNDLGDSTAFEDVIASRQSGLMVVCALADFSTPPKDEDRVQVQLYGQKNWTPFYIDLVSRHADGIGVALTLRANQDNQPQS